MTLFKKAKQQACYQYHLLLLALSFFTRIPVRLPQAVKPDMLHQSSRYFALIGLLIGSLLSILLVLLNQIFPVEIVIILVMAANVLLTGAFHEDGWADAWDGFGGGWTTKQKLNIMKDSRIGTYGAVALLLALLLKYQSMLVLANNIEQLLFLIICANTASRTLATSLIYSISYVTEDSQSKVKPVATQLSLTSLLILVATSAIVFAVGIYYQFMSAAQSLWLIFVLLISYVTLGWWFKRQIGGFTGDCLGAAQVLSELIIYLFFIALVSMSGIIDG